MEECLATFICRIDAVCSKTYPRKEGSIVLDPDVQAYFPDAEAVNTALRGLIALWPRRRRPAREATS